MPTPGIAKYPWRLTKKKNKPSVRTPISKRQQGLHAQITEAREKTARYREELFALDQLLNSFSSDQPRYQLLTEICDALEKLQGMDAAHLCWTEQHIHETPAQTVQRLRQTVNTFQQKIIAVAQSRSALQENIGTQTAYISRLNWQLAEVQEEEAAQEEFVIERTARAVPYRTIVMPWSVQGDDERRYRKILMVFFLLALVCGVLVPQWEVSPPEREEVQIPERLAKFIKKKQAKPVEPKPLEKKKVPEKKEEKINKDAPPVSTETRQARAKAETRGVLAFKNNLADLVADASPAKLGANARISTMGQGGGDGSQRSIIMTQSSSGGINTSNLNRQVTGNVSKNITHTDTKFSRVESTVSTADKEENRKLRSDARPSRTDEEIQIVFDRYKSALYRIYNRELRNDPTLRGKMVLRITIQPDGQVSSCSIKSTDLASPALSTDIVERVLKFNFGPKEGVPAMTILYPIDFLPAN